MVQQSKVEFSLNERPVVEILRELDSKITEDLANKAKDIATAIIKKETVPGVKAIPKLDPLSPQYRKKKKKYKDKPLMTDSPNALVDSFEIISTGAGHALINTNPHMKIHEFGTLKSKTGFKIPERPVMRLTAHLLKENFDVIVEGLPRFRDAKGRFRRYR